VKETKFRFIAEKTPKYTSKNATHARDVTETLANIFIQTRP